MKIYRAHVSNDSNGDSFWDPLLPTLGKVMGGIIGVIILGALWFVLPLF